MPATYPAAAKTVVITLLTLTLSLSFTGCGRDKPAAEQESAPQVFKVEDFADKSFAILSGSSFEGVARNTIGAKLCRYYNSAAEVVEAVVNGEADATLLEEPIARKAAANNPALIVLYPPVDIENYASIFSKTDDGKLRDEFNALLQKIRIDGTYEDMIKRWIDSPLVPEMPEIELGTGRNIKFATSDCDEPFSYKTGEGEAEKLVGFDVELARRFARERGYGLEIEVMDFPDMIPAVTAGRVDFASNLFTVKEERKELVDFSEPVYYGGTVVLTKK